MKHFSFFAAALMAVAMLASCSKKEADKVFNAPVFDWSLNETAVSEQMAKAGYELTETEQEDPFASYYYAPVQTVLGDCAWTCHFYNGLFFEVEGEINMDGKTMQSVKDYFDTHYDLVDVYKVLDEDGYYALYYSPDSVLTELEMGTVNAYVIYSKSLEGEFEDEEVTED